MQAHTTLSCAATPGAAMVLGATALAADLPKGSMFNVTCMGRGSFQAAMTAKGQLFGIRNNQFNPTGNGLFDQSAWHCLGTEVVQGAVMRQRPMPAGPEQPEESRWHQPAIVDDDFPRLWQFQDYTWVVPLAQGTNP